MIVADTSALVSLSVAEILETATAEYDTHTTERVVDELHETGEFDDRHALAAREVLAHLDEITVHEIDSELETARIDIGEGSCALLANELDAAFLLTDDLRALPELETATEAQVAISPFLLRALVTRGVLGNDEARARLETIAAERDWLGAPIYRRARRLFED